MEVDQHLQILENIISEQKSKMLNRIFFTIAWLLIPVLLLVINTLTWTIHLVANPIDVVILLYFFLLVFLFWGLVILFQNFKSWKTLHQLEQDLFRSELNPLKLNEILSANYFFNPWYKMINQELAIVLHNPHFCWQQNQKTLQNQNWKCLWRILAFSFLVSGFFLGEVLYFQKFTLNQWAVAVSFSFVVFFFGLVLPWIVFRQVSLNWKYSQYFNQKIDNYQFIFANRWLFLKTTCEKLEVKDGNFRKSEKPAQ